MNGMESGQGDFAHVLNEFSQSQLTTLVSLNHPANDITIVMQVIAEADHKLLIQARNKAYISMYEKFTEVKLELDAMK